MIKITNNSIELTEAIRFAIGHICKKINRISKEIRFSLILKLDETIAPQGYRRKRSGEAFTITGAGEAEIMYGILDLGREISQNQGLEGIEAAEVTPYLKNRGIKFNIPLDARTPSYSDASDSAVLNIEHMWEFDFWTEFLDRMALERYNVLSLWTLSPFPSLVRIPEYPLTALEDVMRSQRPAKADLSGWGMYTEDMEKSLVTVRKMTIEEKIAFWRSVMEYAKNRCIKIFLFTWNLFVYGTEHNPYGITCDQGNPVTKDYIYCGTKALMDTYPLLAGIGVTSGEHMLRDETDIPFLRDSYGRGVADYLTCHPEREFDFIHRMQYTRYDSIVEEFRDFPCPFGISFKYSQAHMYSDTKPSFIDSFLKEKEEELKIWLTVRNDDYYMYRWGDPEYAREYLRQMPADVMHGYYMGADGYTWGRDYMDLKENTHPLFIRKMWYMFSIWGQLSYHIDLPESYFRKELGRHFDMESSVLYDSWRHASAILSELNRVHWHDYDFQWYPEGCCMYDFETDKLIFADINEFITCQSMPGGGYASVSEYCEAIKSADCPAGKNRIPAAAVKSELSGKIDPLSAADSLRQHADLALEGINRISSRGNVTKELQATLEDITALSYLGYYYSEKLKAAVYLCMYRLNGKKEWQEEAVLLLRSAAAGWKRYSAKSGELYRPQLLTRLCGIVDVQRFDSLADLDISSAEMTPAAFENGKANL